MSIEAQNSSAPGTIDAEVDRHLGLVANSEPAQADNPAQPPSEVEPVNEAADPAQLEQPVVEQAPEPSVTEEASEAPQAEGADLDNTQAEQYVTIQMPDGRTQQLTPDEFERTHMFQGDYTRKTQNLADERRQFEQERFQDQGLRSDLAEKLNVVEQIIQSSMPQPPDPALEEADPVEYLAQEAKYNREIKQLEYIQHQRFEQEQALQQQAMQQDAIHLEQAKAHLATVIPEAKTDMEGWQKSMNVYGEKAGFTQAELAGLKDVRYAVVLDKARRWDESQAAKNSQPTLDSQPQMTPSIAQSNTVQAPRNAMTSRVQKADAALTKLGTVDAAVEYMMAMDEQNQNQG